MTVQDQKPLIRNNNWDVLIILDACRYDTFKQVLPEVDLSGKLKKIDTKVFSTAYWFMRVWEDDKNYMTGNVRKLQNDIHRQKLIKNS